jgi:hypothetical protein
VSDQSGPLPQRIGDAERDRAVEYLRDHLADGRLDQEEFDDRLTRALTARTQADLDPLFSDLPGPKPGQTVANPSPYQAPPWQAGQWPTNQSRQVAPRPMGQVPVRPSNSWAVLSRVAWPVAIVAIIAMHGAGAWWLICIPIILSILAKQTRPPGPRRY